MPSESLCPPVPLRDGRVVGPFQEREAYRIPRRMGKNLRRLLAACLLVLLSLPAPLVAAESPGRDRSAHALTGGRVIAAPGRVFDPGVVVVRGGVIEAVGPVG